MYAIVKTHTEHHPRGSGAAYGKQFERLHAAWHALHDSYGAPVVQLHLSGECEVYTYLYIETDEPQKKHAKVKHRRTLKSTRGESFNVGPIPVHSEDELILIWWDVWGRYDTSPWDPNGIATARRLGLKREAEHDDLLPAWIAEELGRVEGVQGSGVCFETEGACDHKLFDAHCFAAHDRGEFVTRPWHEIWNEASRASDSGWQWD